MTGGDESQDGSFFCATGAGKKLKILSGFAVILNVLKDGMFFSNMKCLSSRTSCINAIIVRRFFGNLSDKVYNEFMKPYLNRQAISDPWRWRPPTKWKIIKTIEAHAGGEPLRVLIHGLPPIPGNTMLAKRRYFQSIFDQIRQGLIWEPRGHHDMYGAVITEPVSKDADIGVLFLHNAGLSTMCGHGIIALATVVIETGMFPAKTPETIIKIDTPAGMITAFCRVQGRQFKRVRSVRFRNVPSFVLALDETVNVPGIGKLRYDLAFGGAFYAYARSEPLALSLVPENASRLIEAGMAIKQAIIRKRSVIHPFHKDLSFLYGTIFIGAAADANNWYRNVCIFADGELDRSPTGTGVSGHLAIHYARGELTIGQELSVESILASCFSGHVVKEINYGPFKAVIPEIKGSAFITGRHEFFFDPEDPLEYGFFVR